VRRKRELDVPDLYRPHGRYAGTNWSAMAALAIGIAPNIPGFLHATHIVDRSMGIFDAIYPYAWFVGFGVAFGIYLGASLTTGRSPAPRTTPPHRDAASR